MPLPACLTHSCRFNTTFSGIAAISACMALNIALNNISLLDVSLTLNQIIRCMTGTDVSGPL